jgi:hypothetical protein
MKRLLPIFGALLAITACAPQEAPPPVAPPVAAALGSPSNTTTAFDGTYGNAVGRTATPGCPDFITGRNLTIRNGLATFQPGAVATGNFQGYVNPQGGLSMTSQQGQTFQGQIDSNFALTGRATGPNCVYDASWNRIQGS